MLIRYIPVFILPFYLIRTAIYGSSLADAFILSALTGLYAFFSYLDSKKEPEANLEVKNRVTQLEKQIEETKSNVTALKIGTQLRNR